MSNFLIDEDTDLLAAEFMLGTLDSEERANAQYNASLNNIKQVIESKAVTQTMETAQTI